MLMGVPWEVGIFIRGTRKELKLSQDELARAAGVGRQWIVAMEKGKETVEIGLVLRTLMALELDVSIREGRNYPPKWSIPFTAARKAHRQRLAANMPRRRRVAKPAPQ